MQNSKRTFLLVALALATGFFSRTNGHAAAPISICDLVVSSTADSGLGSLREAIQCANAVFGPNTITFAIPGAGPHIIRLVEPLPALTDPVTIDGFSQPGSRANTRSDERTDATIQVEIRGTSAIDYGLVLATNDSTVRGLAINSCRTAGVLVMGEGNVLEGTYLGVDTTGRLPLPNGKAGVLVEGSSHRIGGSTPGARNLISGNEGPGIHLQNPTGLPNNGTQVYGNVVGLNPDGAALGNGVGILVENATQIRIGGIGEGLANVIARNQAAGVVVAGPSAWASIVGNSIDNNGGLGIDLQAKGGPLVGDGVTKDDPLDMDEGPNNLQNSPLFLNDITTPTGTTLIGCLNSQAEAVFYIDFYWVETCDPSGRGEGHRYLGRYVAQADQLWNANFTFHVTPALPVDTYVTATATTVDGRTSEFSACRRISGNTNSPLGTLAVGITSSPNPVTVGTPLTYTISLTNVGPGRIDAVSLVNQLPAGLSNVVIKVGGNTCTIADGKVTCDFGTLAEGQVVTVVIEGIPTQPGIYVDTVTATGTSGGKPVVPATGRHETTVIDQPVLTISDTTATEGPGAQATFTIQLSRPATVPVSVTWGTVDGTAKAGTDYVAALGQTVTFQPGETSKTIQVALVDDSVAETPEQFTVHLAAATNAQIGKADGVASLNDNDEAPLPVLAVGITSSPNPVTVGTPLTYTISLTNLGPGSIDAVSLVNQLPAGLSNAVIKVGGNTCTIADGKVTCDFGTLAEGQVVTVVIEGIPTQPGIYVDTVTATGTSGGKPVVPVTGRHDTTVIDLPVLTISDTTATEGPGAEAVFTVQLSRPATSVVSVNLRTIDGTARGGTDYVPALSRTIIFRSGETSKTIPIALVDDSAAEDPEQFIVHLVSATNAQIGKADGVALLTDDDNEAPLSVLAVGIKSTPNPVTVGTVLTYTISVTNLGPGSITDISLANLLPPGLSNVSIRIGGDKCVVADDTLSCELGTLTNGQVFEIVFEGVPTTTGSYLDMVVVTGNSEGRPVVPATAEHETTVIDQPVLTISDTTTTEGPGAQATFTIQLSRPATVPVSVTWGTVDGTAKAGTDYVAALGQTVTFQPGETSKTIQVALVDDSVAENPEQFTVHLAAATNAQIGKADGVASLNDNDEAPLPVLAVGITSSPNPVTLGTPLTYTISLTNLGPGRIDAVSLVNQLPAGLSNVVIKVGGNTCTIADGKVSCDFGTLAEGQVVTVVIEGIPTQPGIYVDTVTATGTSGGKPVVPATGRHETTVIGQPVLTISDTTATEGPGAEAVFTVQLSEASTAPVTVTWRTIDGSAKTGADYLGTTAETLTFQPGETSKTIRIPIVDDTIAEPAEEFSIRLSSPVGGTLEVSEGVARISDNDESALVADIGIAELTGPLSVLVGQNAVYHLTITNRGPDQMGQVFLTNNLPPGVSFVSATLGGTNAPCVVTNQQLVCALGALPAGQSISLQVVLSPEVAGTLVNTFTVSGDGATDPDITNNTATINTPVREVAADDLIATFETEMKLNRQTGLLEQRIKITNTGTTPKPRVRVLFNDLPAGAQIYNAAGLEENIPFVQLNETLQPGESRELVIEYYLPRRAKIPNPRLTMRTGGGLLPQTAEGVAIDTSRTVVLSANRFLLEFPSDPGKLYQVQYSDDGAATWKRATPIVRAANSRYQWIDDGPPKTDRAPSETPMRLYRVFTVPE